ncbi:MerR family transcriptional regulator [Virgisporangium aliadipatigenens]|uniref:MerR family transcriptional regulator n=1 Tax=Virgisporangium aliadipatigenens TaxID=741659 RepID=UPI001942C4E5|nr:MerR family transcriptional regulator [Virgisporangium aliadipatigenens]
MNAREYTIAELAREVGMSPRNIRAHQARGLIARPVRRGRVAYYDFGHRDRLESVKALQRQGFNLAAIEAMLGTGQTRAHNEQLNRLVGRLAEEQPALAFRLERHGITARGDNGTPHVLRPQLLRRALELRKVGLPTLAALHILIAILDRLGAVADDLARMTGGRIRTLTRDPDSARALEPVERIAAGLPDGLAELLNEAFRAAVENLAARPDPVATRRAPVHPTRRAS